MADEKKNVVELKDVDLDKAAGGFVTSNTYDTNAYHAAGLSTKYHVIGRDEFYVAGTDLYMYLEGADAFMKKYYSLSFDDYVEWVRNESKSCIAMQGSGFLGNWQYQQGCDLD